MAQTASAFGFSAIDPIGTLMANKLDAKYGKGMMKYQAKLEHKYRLKAAEEMPSSARAGLIRAGYNPILAINGGANGDYGTVSVTPAAAPSGSSGGFDAEAFNSAKSAKILNQAAVRTAVANADTAQHAALISDLEESSARSALNAQRADDEISVRQSQLEGLLYEGVDPDTARYPSGARVAGLTDYDRAYMRMLKNGMERSIYTNSKDHAIAEDTVNAIHGGSSAFSNITSGFKNIRNSQGRSFNFWITPKERRAAH